MLTKSASIVKPVDAVIAKAAAYHAVQEEYAKRDNALILDAILMDIAVLTMASPALALIAINPILLVLLGRLVFQEAARRQPAIMMEFARQEKKLVNAATAKNRIILVLLGRLASVEFAKA